MLISKYSVVGTVTKMSISSMLIVQVSSCKNMDKVEFEYVNVQSSFPFYPIEWNHRSDSDIM